MTPDPQLLTISRSQPYPRFDWPALIGTWIGSDQLREYRFTVHEETRGNLSGVVAMEDRGGGSPEEVEFTGLRVGPEVVVQLNQTEHTPWVLTGHLFIDSEVTGYWSVAGDIELPVTIRRNEP